MQDKKMLKIQVNLSLITKYKSKYREMTNK